MKIATSPRRRVKNILTMMKSYNIKIGWILLLSFISLHMIVFSHKLKGEAKSRKRILIQNLPPPPDISSTRSQRFPSIEERTRLYMSNWYIPPCADNNNGMVKYQFNKVVDRKQHVWDTLTIHESYDVYSYYNNAGSRINDTSPFSYVLESMIEPDTALFLDYGTLQDCTESMDDVVNPLYEHRIKFRHNMYMYCLDSWNSLVPAVNRVRFELDETKRNSINYTIDNGPQQFPPIIVQFGDLKHSHKYQYLNVPHFKKFRSAALSPSALYNTTNLDATTARIHLTNEKEQQELECYASGQHRTTLQSYHVDYDNLMYYQPIVWKFASRRHFMMLPTIRERDTQWGQKTNQAVFYGQLTGSRDIYDTSISQEANCYNLRRCRLVYESAKSKYVHARLTNTRGKLPKVLNGVELVSKKVDISYLLTFKGIIMLEGNDVASGLKWALLSQSVVLMPQPKHTSWAMEELLQPWVHYVPISEELDDVEEKMRWVIENDDYAYRIAQRGSQWMQDLVFHPDAEEDDRLIQEEMIRRYVQYYVPDKAVNETNMIA